MAELTAVIEALSRGLVVGVPTDTVYGLAADPMNQGAVDEIFRLKGRSEGVPLVVLVAATSEAVDLVELPGDLWAGIDRGWPGALTIIGRSQRVMAHGVGDPVAQTLGVRVPDHPELLQVLTSFGPLAVTSANRSGEAAALSHREAEAVFGPEIVAYLPGRCAGGEASTVVDFTTSPPRTIREGPATIG